MPVFGEHLTEIMSYHDGLLTKSVFAWDSFVRKKKKKEFFSE